jgi:predicted DCC family thiol-disulfide oxidoreductase YuxK
MIHRAVIFYDAACGLCDASVRRWQRVLLARGFKFQPMQSLEGARQMCALSGQLPTEFPTELPTEFPTELPGEMKLLTSAGTLIGGVDAIAYIARHIWWAFPVHLLLVITPTRTWAQAGYRWLAPRRHRISRWLRLRPPQPFSSSH